MSVMIGMASRDERGAYSGGVPGDQTGQEVYIRSWYSRPWDCVIRARNTAVAEKIAIAMEQACNNPFIGYDQKDRTSLYQCARTAGWNLAAVNQYCECDCSSLVAVCLNAAGVMVPKDVYTGNLKAACMASGQFLVFSGSEYTASDLLLRRGDILLNERYHTAVVTKGADASSVVVPVVPYAVTVTVSDYLQCRTEPSSARGSATEYRVSGQSKRMVKNEITSIWREAYDASGGKWGAINAITPYCWISLKYTKRS